MNGRYDFTGMMLTGKKNSTLGFVVCASNANVLNQYLLASPCLKSEDYYQAIYFNVSSAASAFNAEIQQLTNLEWLVWVHQDVLLPAGWDKRFIAGIEEASRTFPRLAVVGVYGVAGGGAQAVRAGSVLDRGEKLKEPTPLPCPVDSLDELLIAVRTDAGLRFDPALGFDFYATDIALMARQRGLEVAVIDAFCEHWSSTPKGIILPQMASRVISSAKNFEQKWAHALPLDTPCFSIGKVGDVALQCKVS